MEGGKNERQIPQFDRTVKPTAVLREFNKNAPRNHTDGFKHMFQLPLTIILNILCEWKNCN
jgi:hypothetical protein